LRKIGEGIPGGRSEIEGMDAEKEVGSKEEYMAMKETTSRDRLRRTYGGRAELEKNEEGSDRIWLH
jgi:hypothetical protein